MMISNGPPKPWAHFRANITPFFLQPSIWSHFKLSHNYQSRPVPDSKAIYWESPQNKNTGSMSVTMSGMMLSPKMQRMQRSVRINDGQLLGLAEKARYDSRLSGYLYKRSSDNSKWLLRWFRLYQVSPLKVRGISALPCSILAGINVHNCVKCS